MAGYLYGVGVQRGFTGLAWWGSGIVAIVGAVQALSVDKEKHTRATMTSVSQFIAPAVAQQRGNKVIDFEVNGNGAGAANGEL